MACGRVEIDARGDTVKGGGLRIVLARFAGQRPAAFDVPAVEIRIGDARRRVEAVERIVEAFALGPQRLVLAGQFETGRLGVLGIERAGVDQTRAVDAQFRAVAQLHGIAHGGRRTRIGRIDDGDVVDADMDQPVEAPERRTGQARGDAQLFVAIGGGKGGGLGVQGRDIVAGQGQRVQPAVAVAEDAGAHAVIAGGQRARHFGRRWPFEEGL